MRTWLWLAGVLGWLLAALAFAEMPYRVRPEGIYQGERAIALYGLVWFGLETCDLAPHGLWSGRSVADMISRVRDLGFNALRLPVGSQVLRDQGTSSDWARIGDPAYPTSPLAGLRYLLGKAQEQGVYVLLSFTTFRCDLPAPGRPFDDAQGYRKEDWLADLARLAELSREFPNVVAINLFNQPHELTWQEWSGLVQEGAQAILAVNPGVLVAVEGVGNLSDNGGYSAFWGGNLTEARDALGVEGQLLYLPLVYGPAVYPHAYFSAPNFPDNMPEIWDIHFGHLADRGLFWGIGEFGGTYVDQDRVFQNALAAYLQQRGVNVWFYWALNPNSEHTGGGVLSDDWYTPVADKVQLLQRLMAVD